MILTQYWVTHCDWHSDLKDDASEDGRDIEVYKADEVRAVLKEMTEHLEHVREYWNGSPNMRAMQDALEHIDRETDKMLTRVQEIAP